MINFLINLVTCVGCRPSVRRSFEARRVLDVDVVFQACSRDSKQHPPPPQQSHHEAQIGLKRGLFGHEFGGCDGMMA